MLRLKKALWYILCLIILTLIAIPMLLGKVVEYVGWLIVIIGAQLQRPYNQPTPNFIKNISNKLEKQ